MSFRTSACKEIIGLLGRVPKKPVKVGKPNINYECSVLGKRAKKLHTQSIEAELQRIEETNAQIRAGKIPGANEFHPAQSDVRELGSIGVHVEYGKDYLASSERYGSKKHKIYSKNTAKKFLKRSINPKKKQDLRLLGLDEKTVEELNKMEFGDFIANSSRIICEKFGIPEKLMPQFTYGLNNLFWMQYKPFPNAILLSSHNFRNLFTKNISRADLTKLINERADIFGALKHELTHLKQILDLFRTKGIGEKAVSRLGKANANFVCADIKCVAETFTEQQLQAIANHPNFPIIMQYRELLKQSPELAEKCLADVEKNTANSFISMLNERRKLIISEMGEISAKSEAGKNAKRDLRYFARGSNSDAIQTVKGKERYLNKRAEKEAYRFGDAGTLEYLCPDLGKKLSIVA